MEPPAIRLRIHARTPAPAAKRLYAPPSGRPPSPSVMRQHPRENRLVGRPPVRPTTCPEKKYATCDMAQTASPKIDIYDIADRLWETADELRANSHLKAAEYSIPVLGLIFLKFADSRFTQTEAELAGNEHRPPGDRQGRLPGEGRPLPPRAVPVREPASPEGGGQPRQGHQRRDGRDRGGEPGPEGRPSPDLPVAHQRHAGQSAALGERHPRRHRGRRLRQGLRVLPRQVRGSPRVPRAASTSRRHRSSG